MTRKHDIILIGASVRAAAQSAIRAGFTPWCSDRFCDADLLCVVPDAVQCPFDQYPHQFLHMIERAPHIPWMYTGGLENYPDLVDAIASFRPLWGNNGTVLRRVRDPFFLNQALCNAGLDVPAVSNTQTDFPPDVRTVRKPLFGSAGQGVRFATEDDEGSENVFFQEYIEGESMSAVFVALPNIVVCWGVTKQLIGTSWLNTSGFHYAGNIGPLVIADELMTKLQQIGDVLVEACGLRGVFGIDFVVADRIPYVVEVNPRYTASVEVLEAQTNANFAVLSGHAKAFGGAAQSPFVGMSRRLTSCIGKGVLFASSPLTITASVQKRLLEDDLLADIPKIGDVMEPGWPIVTLFAQGASVDECEAKLQMRAKELQSLFA